MERTERFLAGFFLFFGVVFTIWFIDDWLAASIPFLKDKFIFVAHWSAELVAVILSLVIAVRMLMKQKVLQATVLFTLGLILSASFNGAIVHLAEPSGSLVALRLGIVFIAAMGSAFLGWRYSTLKTTDTSRKLGLISIGILINMHSDTLLSFALQGSWAAFVHSLVLVLAGLYFLGVLVRFEGDAETAV